jgi:hypothetical protein
MSADEPKLSLAERKKLFEQQQKTKDEVAKSPVVDKDKAASIQEKLRK